jgi:hypothetical protein
MQIALNRMNDILFFDPFYGMTLNGMMDLFCRRQIRDPKNETLESKDGS